MTIDWSTVIAGACAIGAVLVFGGKHVVALTRLTVSIEAINETLKTMPATLNDHDKRLAVIEWMLDVDQHVPRMRKER